jgi:hypothetical protein
MNRVASQPYFEHNIRVYRKEFCVARKRFRNRKMPHNPLIPTYSLQSVQTITHIGVIARAACFKSFHFSIVTCCYLASQGGLDRGCAMFTPSYLLPTDRRRFNRDASRPYLAYSA